MPGTDRHAHLLSVEIDERGIVAVGPGDAPMTHSGDTAKAPMALGGLDVTLR